MSDTRIATLSKAATMLRAAREQSDPFIAKEVRDVASAAAKYAKQKKLGQEAVDHANAIELDADRVLSELLALSQKATGTRSQLKGKDASGGAKIAPPESTMPTFADLGLSKHDAKEIRAIGKLAEPEFKEARDEGKTPAQVERERREREAKAALTQPVDIEIDGLYRGDFRELAANIPDESAQLVFTDPPYDRDSLPLYEAAAKEAARVLRPGGSMICYVGQVLLPDALPLMAKHLRYWWTAACVHEGGNQMMQKLGIRCGWKPMLWFVKGTRGDVASVMQDTVSGAREKDAHEWQQAEAEARHFIEGLTTPGGLVVDFFAGGGTTCLAAEKLGRKWVAFEVDARHYNSAAKRLGSFRDAA